jgi:hypothetical protein
LVFLQETKSLREQRLAGETLGPWPLFDVPFAVVISFANPVDQFVSAQQSQQAERNCFSDCPKPDEDRGYESLVTRIHREE